MFYFRLGRELLRITNGFNNYVLTIPWTSHRDHWDATFFYWSILEINIDANNVRWLEFRCTYTIDLQCAFICRVFTPFESSWFAKNGKTSVSRQYHLRVYMLRRLSWIICDPWGHPWIFNHAVTPTQMTLVLHSRCILPISNTH